MFIYSLLPTNNCKIGLWASMIFIKFAYLLRMKKALPVYLSLLVLYLRKWVYSLLQFYDWATQTVNMKLCTYVFKSIDNEIEHFIS